ncbi:MAG: NDP-sugar synthase [Oligoflexales bacterium]
MTDVKGFILAAGFGTRLKPITNTIPKPLVPFLGVKLVDFAIRQMSRSKRISGLGANSHYLGDQIRHHFSKQRLFPSEIMLSHENEILGTGGFVNPIRGWTKTSHLLVFNSDVVCDVSIDDVIRSHESAQNAVATMVLIPHQPGTTPVTCKDDRVVAFGDPNPKLSKWTFSGIHLLSPEFLKNIPGSGSPHIIDTYKELLQKGARINYFHHQGTWLDLGDLRNYFQSTMEYLKDFSKIDSAFGISEIWRIQGSKLKWIAREESGVVGPSIVPLELELDSSLTIGPEVALYSEIEGKGPASPSRCISFSSAEGRKSRVASNSICLDDVVIKIS